MFNKNPHINTGDCKRCDAIMDKYPGFSEELRVWFKKLQKEKPDTHCSAAGRGKDEQELFFKQGTSKAHWKQSPHNYNLAIDFIRLGVNGVDWGISWYNEYIGPEARKAGFMWGGDFKSFPDRPHVEVKNWKELVKDNKVKLVE